VTHPPEPQEVVADVKRLAKELGRTREDQDALAVAVKAAETKLAELGKKTEPILASLDKQLATLSARIEKLDTFSRDSHKNFSATLEHLDKKCVVLDLALSSMQKEIKGATSNLGDLGEKLSRERDERAADIADLRKAIVKKNTYPPDEAALFAHAWKLSEVTKGGKSILDERENVTLEFRLPSTVILLKDGKEFGKPGYFRILPSSGLPKIAIASAGKWMPPGAGKFEGVFEVSKDRLRILVLDKGFPERFDPLEYPNATLYIF